MSTILCYKAEMITFVSTTTYIIFSSFLFYNPQFLH